LDFIDAPIIGVTGTNGKTLTVSVVGDIYKLAKKENIVAGNIGYPLIDVVDRISKNGRIIAEISSFQLEWIEKFKPYIGILLNISSNHLDRHHDLNKYTKTKLRIFSNQTKSDFAILNYDEPPVLIRGRGTPVTGNNPLTTLIFIKACPTMYVVIPIDNNLPSGFSILMQIEIPQMASIKYKTATEIVPNKPNSSPIIANIKSV
ncbi:unnamed protein product, partial [marine sediment metagenome]